MIVWHLVSKHRNSAVTEYALSAARALEIAGHQSLFTPLAGSPAHRRAEAAGLEVVPVDGFGIRSLLRLMELARTRKPQAIMTYGGPETVLSRPLGKAAGAFVVRFRGREVADAGILGRTRHRLSHAHVVRLLTPSRGLAEALRVIDSRRPIDTVPLGCDEAKYRRIQPSGGARPELVVLGRLDPVKGHAALFKMFAAMKPLWTRAARPRLHVVGEPANLKVEDLKTAAVQCGLTLEDDIVFTATRIDVVEQLLSAAALGVVPSLRSEIIARVAQEFLLCGTPIVVSGVGALEEALCFEAAGASYRGLDEAAAACVLRSWTEKSLDEGEAAKVKRAERARALFSLKTMGHALGGLLVACT